MLSVVITRTYSGQVSTQVKKFLSVGGVVACLMYPLIPILPRFISPYHWPLNIYFILLCPRYLASDLTGQTIHYGCVWG